MNLAISGRVALVTGGSHGIGLAAARGLAEEGCRVAICARNSDRVNSALRELQALGAEALGVSADVLRREDIDRVFQTVIDAWGTIHILVNNVGGGGRWGSPIVEDTAEDVWIDVYNKNALAAIRFTRLAIPYMRRQHWGRVVTVGSILGREGGGRPWFNMAKSAEISLMKTLAMTPYLVRDGLTFNTVAPGSIMIADTGWDAERLADPRAFAARLEREFPLGRLGLPEEVASVIVFACSETARLMNGATIVVDGGESHSF
jgi:3-oxoacyl-[acyl-carrier protein] reductase